MTTLLTSAIVTGLIGFSVAQAEEKAAEQKGDKVATEKQSCKGEKSSCGGKNGCSCKDKKDCKDHKMKKGDKNSCKNGCGGEAKDMKKEETK